MNLISERRKERKKGRKKESERKITHRLIF
jgi:hypothetical protein